MPAPIILCSSVGDSISTFVGSQVGSWHTKFLASLTRCITTRATNSARAIVCRCRCSNRPYPAGWHDVCGVAPTVRVVASRLVTRWGWWRDFEHVGRRCEDDSASFRRRRRRGWRWLGSGRPSLAENDYPPSEICSPPHDAVHRRPASSDPPRRHRTRGGSIRSGCLQPQHEASTNPQRHDTIRETRPMDAMTP
jgi:hypothetical protein